MCGIAGIFHLDGSPIHTQQLLAMTRVIRHRGPDDEGFLLASTENNFAERHSAEDSIDEVKIQHRALPEKTQGNLGMGFRRLAIIDLSAGGHQPYTDENETCYLTFNGQIYNYLEIRNELEAYGMKFRSSSDTEVLLKSYLHWGVDCLQKFIGMFAFVIYDKANKCLFVARDRLGVKPFVYYYGNQKFIWASEEKQLVTTGLVKANVNESVMIRFLRDIALFESNETFFQDIHQLPPGAYALVNAQGIRIKKYWHLDLSHTNVSIPWESAKEKTNQLLTDAVKLRLRSDVPLGIALSGGIDSSSISSVARKLTQDSIRTFSVYYEGKEYDERPYIEEVLKLGGFNQTFHTGEQNCSIEQIQKWIFHQDAPTSGASPFSAYQNYQNVRRSGITVLLNGQGGDELFAGYPYYFKYLLAQQFHSNQLNELLNNIWHYGKYHGLKALTKQLYLSFIAYQGKFDKLRQTEYHKYSTQTFYPREFGLESENSLPQNFFVQSLYHGITRSHLPHMLRWEDRNSMAHSVESRVPFLDHRLVEFAFMLPDVYKIHKGVQKYILRESMKQIVPNSILLRKDKIGFATPTDKWTSGPLYLPIRELIHDPLFLSRTWIEGARVKKEFEKSPTHFRQHELWRIMTAELWHRQFIDPVTPKM